MKKMQVSATVPEKKDAAGKVTQKKVGPFAVSVDFPTTLDEAKKMYGEEAVLSNAFANWRVTIQAGMRTAMKAGSDQTALQSKYSNAKMGVATTGQIDPTAAFTAQFRSAPPEKQAEMLKMLQAAAAGK
jgi:hypothetical protein